jgi:hypothetical protein
MLRLDIQNIFHEFYTYNINLLKNLVIYHYLKIRILCIKEINNKIKNKNIEKSVFLKCS